MNEIKSNTFKKNKIKNIKFSLEVFLSKQLIEEDFDFEFESEDNYKINYDKNIIHFALCDGVSNSFYGNVGSKLLSDEIINYFNNNETIDIDNFSNYLNEITKKAEKIINDIPLDHLSGFGLEVQKNIRDNYGTQSNFVCGSIFLPTLEIPNGKIEIFWLGNSEIHLWNLHNEKRTGEYADTWDTTEGWSSKKGINSEIHHFSTDLSNISTIICYSDGLSPIKDQLIPDISLDAIEKLSHKLQTSHFNDDISYIKIVLNDNIILKKEKNVVIQSNDNKSKNKKNDDSSINIKHSKEKLFIFFELLLFILLCILVLNFNKLNENKIDLSNLNFEIDQLQATIQAAQDQIDRDNTDDLSYETINPTSLSTIYVIPSELPTDIILIEPEKTLLSTPTLFFTESSIIPLTPTGTLDLITSDLDQDIIEYYGR